MTSKVRSAYSVDPLGNLTVDSPDLDNDFNGHGTQVASLICADHPEIGVAPDARLVSVRFNQGATTNYGRIRQALEGLIQRLEAGEIDVDLINLSSGLRVTTSGQRQGLQNLFQRLLELEILPITAVGHDCRPNETWCPASLPESLAVGAACEQFGVWGRGCSGPCAGAVDPLCTKPDLLAPGRKVSTCTRGGSYGSPTGTSFAAPICAGVAALVLEGAGAIGADDLRDALVGTCVTLQHVPRLRQRPGLVQVP